MQTESMQIKIKYLTLIITTIFVLIFTVLMVCHSVQADDYTLSAHERVVYNYTDFSNALIANNGISTIYFGADITMTAGISVDSSKTNLVVSGMNPLDPNQTVPYTLTDMPSSTQSRTVYLNNNSIKSLLVTDLNIVGQNYFGPFSASALNASPDLVMTYQRVVYSGPQIGYHRNGTLRFIDCEIYIHEDNDGSVKQECLEAKYVSFEGENSIDSKSNLTSTLWLHNGGTFTILDHSSLTVKALNLGTSFGIFYADAYKIDISIGTGAAFHVETNGPFNLTGQAPIHSFTVNENGIFHLKTTKAAATMVMNMNGNLFLDKNSEFVMDGYGGSSYYLLAQRAGQITVNEGATFHLVTDSSYSSLLALYGSSFICNDPASVLFRTSGGTILKSEGTVGTIYINAEQVNYWNTVTMGLLDTPPLRRWKKADGSNFIIEGKPTILANGNFTTLTSSYTEGDSPDGPPTSANFNMASAKVLSFGRLELVIYEVDENSVTVNGSTAPGAVVRASFTQEGVDYVMPDVVSDDLGLYSVVLNTEPLRDTTVIVRSTLSYLYAVSSVLVNPVARIEMTVPEQIVFQTTGISPQVQIVGRVDTDWGIRVTDTHGTGHNWKVYVRASVPLTGVEPPGIILGDALIYANPDGMVTPLGSDKLVLIYDHTTASDHDSTDIHWAANRGILVRVSPEDALAGHYMGQLEWFLTNTP